MSKTKATHETKRSPLLTEIVKELIHDAEAYPLLLRIAYWLRLSGIGEDEWQKVVKQLSVADPVRIEIHNYLRDLQQGRYSKQFLDRLEQLVRKL